MRNRYIYRLFLSTRLWQGAELTKDRGGLIKEGTIPVTVDTLGLITALTRKMDTDGVFK